jgi:hypothetical protein
MPTSAASEALQKLMRRYVRLAELLPSDASKRADRRVLDAMRKVRKEILATLKSARERE